jgi:hypothetical protein
MPTFPSCHTGDEQVPKQINMIRRSSYMLVAFLLAAPTVAQDLPKSALTSYDSFRVALLKNGWLPDDSYGIKNDDVSAMYKFPEVICGNSLCTAQWIAKNRRKLNIVLWRDDAGDYRVAPQMDWPD